MRSLLNHLNFGRKSADTAKNRLQVIIAQQRAEKNTPDYLPILRQEIMAVIAKYVTIEEKNINVDFHNKDNNSILELNVVLPTDDPA